MLVDICSSAGWYWGSISAGEAKEALLTKPEGTFLLRDSSHPQFMLALSVKTRCGPTSVRIDYNRGCFWLDSISRGAPHLKTFSDVLSLIQHYTVSGQTSQDLASFKTKADPSQHAAKDAGVPLRLVRPLHRREGFPSLQHLARLTINKQTNCPDQLPLPKPLLDFLQNYPFIVWGCLSVGKEDSNTPELCRYFSQAVTIGWRFLLQPRKKTVVVPGQ